MYTERYFIVICNLLESLTVYMEMITITWCFKLMLSILDLTTITIGSGFEIITKDWALDNCTSKRWWEEGRKLRQRLSFENVILPAMRETWVQSLGWEDPLEKGTANNSSILVWRIPWAEEPGRLQSMGLQRVGHDWATFNHSLWIN